MKKSILFLISLVLSVSITFMILNVNNSKSRNDEKIEIMLPKVEEEFERYEVTFKYDDSNKTEEKIIKEINEKQDRWIKIIQGYGGKDITYSSAPTFWVNLKHSQSMKLEKNIEVENIELGQFGGASNNLRTIEKTKKLKKDYLITLNYKRTNNKEETKKNMNTVKENAIKIIQENNGIVLDDYKNLSILKVELTIEQVKDLKKYSIIKTIEENKPLKVELFK